MFRGFPHQRLELFQLFPLAVEGNVHGLIDRLEVRLNDGHGDGQVADPDLLVRPDVDEHAVRRIGHMDNVRQHAQRIEVRRGQVLTVFVGACLEKNGFVAVNAEAASIPRVQLINADLELHVGEDGCVLDREYHFRTHGETLHLYKFLFRNFDKRFSSHLFRVLILW